MRTIPAFRWRLLSLFFLVVSPVGWAGESEVDKLLDLLVEKGVVTKEESAGFRADLAVQKQEEKEKQKEFSVIAGKPIKISGYTQIRYQALAEKDKNDSFDVRRARLDIKGDITERFDYRFQGEFAGSSAKLLDATIGYKVNPDLKFTVGQFKVPFSQENLISSPKLETINRSQVVEALVARGKDVIGNQNGRDIGVQASGSFKLRDDRTLFDYAVGLFNGSGINTSDANDQKDFASRVVFHPIKGLDVGGSYYNGEGKWGKTTATNQNRDRVGVEFAYGTESLTLKGEYIAGKDGTTKKDGWYLLGGYYVIPKKVQGVVKYDSYDPDTEASTDKSNVATLGANWYVAKWALLQLNYELKKEQGKEIDNNALLAQLTLQF
ncbi:MAG: porin [bacterium]|nr:porin [bacterium]